MKQLRGWGVLRLYEKSYTGLWLTFMPQVDKLEAVADRGYFNGEESICVTLPKLMTSGAKSEGRFGNSSICRTTMFIAAPPERSSKFHYANRNTQKMRRYWTNACKTCAIKKTPHHAMGT